MLPDDAVFIHISWGECNEWNIYDLITSCVSIFLCCHPSFHPTPNRADTGIREVSLTAPPPTNAAGRQLTSADSPLTEEDFYNAIDSNLSKVEAFTLQKVTDLRSQIASLEKEVNTVPSDDEKAKDAIRDRADDAAKDFLTLEKYVNINFMAFHKILKKHDKNLPDHACKQFYINRMHNQAWVRGDYSDVVVRLSSIYSALRNDHTAEENKDAAQSFLRSTTKYWVRTEDVSKVKYAVLKHLPVFLQKTSTGESDSQLTNSVYFDNDQLELYHGRLDKTPGAIAFRLRWYGAGDPKTVFFERKTHRDTWTGEASAKERFIVSLSSLIGINGVLICCFFDSWSCSACNASNTH
jgi:SPX domain protein involved in polyphosphate accumulation